MPEGQFTGARAVYIYNSDADTDYYLTLDKTLGDLAGCGLTAATTATAASPPPKRFRPRIVYWEGTLNGKTVRKALVCEKDSTLYQAETSQALTIDGVEGVTTGRRGEKFTFTKLPAAT
jgi:hypothetical protein